MLRQQLNRFSEIDPEAYARLQEVERQTQILEEPMKLRERQLEEQVGRLVLETAIGAVLPSDREARWDSAAAPGGVTQEPPCSRAAWPCSAN